MTTRQRLAVLLAVILVVGVGSAAYALTEFRRGREISSRPPTVPTAGTTGTDGSAPTLTGPRIVFRHTGLDQEYGVVAEVPLSDPSGPRTFTGVSCDRVAAVATGASCLRTQRGVVTTFAQLDLNSDWSQRESTALPGIPSRTRMSTDGTLEASTSFVTGHSYMTAGFSTATEIHRVGGASYGNLESFALYLDGRRSEPTDRNIWGVTFAPDDRTFYATVSTHGVTYLAQGDLATRTLRSIARSVECPSLSPDGTRIAFKQKVDHASGTWWTPAVLDLRTMRRTVLSGETHNVDDQIAWLDDSTLLYGLPREGEAGVTDVWSLAASAGARPALFIQQAWSPTVVR
jgi:hypothetical protein